MEIESVIKIKIRYLQGDYTNLDERYLTIENWEQFSYRYFTKVKF